MSRRAALLLLLVAGCTVERTALMTVEVATPITSCAEAFAAAPGHACAFKDVCAHPLADDPLCCKEIVLCPAGKLVRDEACDPGCSACKGDGECPFGSAVCELGHCLSCPKLDACAPCPDSWFPVPRNGCPTCDCVPKSQCTVATQCGDGVCYRGSVCAPGCSDLSCCANVCGPAPPPRCPEPAPLGCSMKCPLDSGCGSCVASPCQCGLDGKWHCKPVCSTVAATCFHIE